MAYPQDSIGLDPRTQRIIEGAGAGNDDELFADTPFNLLDGPAAQAPPTFSHHFNNGNSLQEMFAYQASPPARSSLVRPSMPQGEALQTGYQPEPYSEHYPRLTHRPQLIEISDFKNRHAKATASNFLFGKNGSAEQCRCSKVVPDTTKSSWSLGCLVL